MKIKDILQHLSRRGLGRSAAQTTFYNYLQNFCDTEDSFSIEHLDSFYDRCMTLVHWRQNKQELGEYVQSELKGFEIPGIENSLHAHQIQWMEIEEERDFLELIDQENEILKKRSEDIRTLNLSKDTLRIRRTDDGTIRVEQKGRLAFIEGHRLHLARPLTSLSYNNDLELSEGKTQILQLSPLVVARFEVNNEMIEGVILQGIGLSRGKSLRGHLEDNEELFYALKRLEKHYINSQTDPHYLAIVSQLEKSIQLSRTGHPDQKVIAHEILKKAERFAQEVFKDDSRLNHLISTLMYASQKNGLSINNQQSGTQVVKSWQKPLLPEQTR